MVRQQGCLNWHGHLITVGLLGSFILVGAPAWAESASIPATSVHALPADSLASELAGVEQFAIAPHLNAAASLDSAPAPEFTHVASSLTANSATPDAEVPTVPLEQDASQPLVIGNEQPYAARLPQVKSVAIAPPTVTTQTLPTHPCVVSRSALDLAQQPPTTTPAPNSLDLDPQIIEQSPVLQRWMREVPDVLSDIDHDPSFRTRVRVGYSHFPGHRNSSGWNVGVEDAFVGKTGLTLSADYQGTFAGDRHAWGGELRYYVRPLGKYINLAPVIGYRNLQTPDYSSQGLNVGARLVLALSRGGAADLSLSHSWVAPGSEGEVGLTTLSTGYALTKHLRLAADIQKQNARQSKDSRIGIVLEWMP